MPRVAKQVVTAHRGNESAEQRQFVKWFRADPRLANLPACAIPNGGKRGVREVAKLRAEGVSNGAPDWMLFADSWYIPKRHGLALEFKHPSGSGGQSDEQVVWERRLTEQGWRYEVVRTAEEAWAVLGNYLGLDL